MFVFQGSLISSNNVKVTVAQPALTAQRVVTSWLLHFCLVCDQITHATIQNQPNKLYINKNLKVCNLNNHCELFKVFTSYFVYKSMNEIFNIVNENN